MEQVLVIIRPEYLHNFREVDECSKGFCFALVKFWYREEY